MPVSDFYTARWPDFICISAHYKYVMMMMMMMMNDLERLFHVKIRFRLAFLKLERLNVKK